MRNFRSLSDFAEHLAYTSLSTVGYEHMLGQIGWAIRNRAVLKLGHKQLAVGKFPAWQDLAPYTQWDRAKRGYPPDEPLMVEGDLQASIEHHVDMSDHSVTIGTHSIIGLWQEVGTRRIPARSFLGASAAELLPSIKQEIEQTVMGHIVGGAGAFGQVTSWVSPLAFGGIKSRIPSYATGPRRRFARLQGSKVKAFLSRARGRV